MFVFASGPFSRAAFTPATREVCRAPQVGQAALDLTGPGRSWPFAFDEDAGVPRISIGDLSVSAVPIPAPLLPPAFGTPSAEQKRFRQEVHGTL